MFYEVLVAFGIVCVLAWLALHFVKPIRRDAQAEVKTLPNSENDRAGGGLPPELSPATIQHYLEAYSGDRSSLEKYVWSLRERFEGHFEIKVIEQNVRKANVRKELLDAACEMLRAERRLRRLPQKEDLKDARLETQLLEEQAKQQEVEWKIEHGEELRDLEHQHKVRDLEKKIADQDPKPAKKLSRAEMLAAKLEAQDKIKNEIQTREAEELRLFRLSKRAKPARDPKEYEDESAWLADWREVGGNHEDLVLSEYENIKKRYRKMLDGALEDLNK